MGEERPLSGSSAIVTGGGRGFGRAIAMALAQAGAAVTITGRTADELARTVADIAAAGGTAGFVTGDVRSAGHVAEAVAYAESRHGPVDLLVNNAGLAGPYGPVGVVDPDAWWAALEVHVRAPMLFLTAVLPGMQLRGRGRIVNIVSVGGRRVEPNLSAYCVGKAAAIRLTEHIGVENRGNGIAAFALHPGDAVTALAHSTLNDPDAQRWRPEMIGILKDWVETADTDAALQRCGAVCVELLSGRHDALSGRYLEPGWDLAALAGQPAEPVFLHP